MGTRENETKACNGKIILNGREVTAAEFERQSEAVKNQKGAKLEEVSKGSFRIRLDG